MRSAAIQLCAIALALATSGVACASRVTPTPEPSAAATWAAVSPSGSVSGRLGPEAGTVQIGRIQSWILELRDAAGEPLSGARVAIGGGMPAHGHGLPTEPRVTAALPEGRYRIEGMKLNMHGDWVIDVAVETPSLRDQLRFLVRVDF